MLEDLAAELREIRASQPEKLTVGAGELLKNVPFFDDMPESEFLRRGGQTPAENGTGR